MAPDQRILLPGGAGLVGQNLIPRLKARGYTNLVVIDKHTANLATLARLHPDITVIAADLAEEGPWQDLFAGAHSVVMLQAQIGGPTIDPFQRNNVVSTRNVLHAMRAHNVNHLVHISSSVVESVADDFYTATKREQEQVVRASGLDAVILRPTLMFGWFDRKHLGWLSRFMKSVPVFPIPGSGRFMRQPLYVGDFCDIIISCIANRRKGETFNISGRDRIDYIDMIRAIKRAVGAKAMIVRIPYSVFYALLWTWALFDRNPPFTTQQLAALVAGDEFEVIDWPAIFGVTATPFAQAVTQTFNDPVYSAVTLEF